ncbi:MAG: translation initiation factor IF-3 [Paenibacillaceae bacterium]
MILNEQIKASEVQLTGLQGENMGVVSRAEAFALAKQFKVDLVCTSLMSSPPPCKLISRGAAKQSADQANSKLRKEDKPKVKEIRLTAHIEAHDYETKQRQAEKLLASGCAVQFVVKLQNKEGPKAKELLEQMLKDLASSGTKATGIQVSGKQAAVLVNPK